MTPLQPLPDHEYLTTTETAACLGIHNRTLEHHLRRGRLKGAARIPGRGRGGHEWRIPRSTVAAIRREMGVNS